MVVLAPCIAGAVGVFDTPMSTFDAIVATGYLTMNRKIAESAVVGTIVVFAPSS